MEQAAYLVSLLNIIHLAVGNPEAKVAAAWAREQLAAWTPPSVEVESDTEAAEDTEEVKSPGYRRV